MAASELAALFDSHSSIAPQYKVVRRAEILKTKLDAEKSDKVTDRDSLNKQTETREAKTQRKLRQPDPREERTVFVGGLPINYTRKQVKHLLKQYGAVESVRLRSLLVDKGKLPAKVARKTHQQLAGTSLNAYVVFERQEDAEKALALNGTLLEGKHLRVDGASRNGAHKHKCSVFLGNLPFTVDEEAVRGLFSDCGDIESVRIVRDAKSGVGKGFGFVTFKDRSGVLFALKKNGKAELEGRALRIHKSKEVALKSSAGTTHRGKPSPGLGHRALPKGSARDGKQFQKPSQKKVGNSGKSSEKFGNFRKSGRQVQRPVKAVQQSESLGENLDKSKSQKGQGGFHKRTGDMKMKKSWTGHKQSQKRAKQKQQAYLRV